MRLSLRLRLLFVLLIAVIPAVVTMTLHATSERRRNERNGAEASLTLARRAASRLDAAVGTARITMTGLARAHVLRLTSRSRPDAIFADMLRANPTLSLLGTASPDGRILHVAPYAGSDTLSLGAREWFRRAADERIFAAGPAVRDPRTGEAYLWCAEPAADTPESSPIILFARISLDHFRDTLADFSLPPGGVLFVADPQGEIVLRIPSRADSTVGRLPADLVAQMRGRPAGTLEARRFMHGGRLYTFATAREADGISVLSLPLGAAYAGARATFGWSLLTFAFLVFAVLAGLWLGEHFVVLRPFASLAEAARGISRGDPGARGLLPHDPGEIGEIAGAVEQLASSLEQRGSALLEGEQRFRALLEHTTDAIITIDASHRIVLFNAAAERTFRCPVSEAIGRPLDRFIPMRHRSEHERLVERFFRTGTSARNMGHLEIIPGLRADGEEFPMEATISRTEIGGQWLSTVILRDVTARIEAENALRRSEAFKSGVLEASLDAIVPFDDRGNILDFNPAAERLFGSTQEEMVGRDIAEVLVPPDLRPTFREFVGRAFDADGNPRPGRKVEIAAVRSDGAEFPAELVVAAIATAGAPPTFVATFRDITGRQQYEQALRTMSLVDDLTGLYNRRGFFAFAQQQVRLADRTRTPVWLLFADVDNLKAINDTFGHQEGDRALADTGRVLRDTFRDSDVIARIAGDEFVVMAVEGTELGVERMVRRFRERLERFVREEQRPYPLTVSIGRARYDPTSPRPIEDLLAEGDAAMYERKRARRRDEER